jgi:hypothetical protein
LHLSADIGEIKKMSTASFTCGYGCQVCHCHGFSLRLLLQFSFADRFKVGKAKPAKKSSKMLKVSRKCE